MRKLSPGMVGWVAVAVAVVTADLLDEKTMSQAFRSASRHPVAGPVVLVAWGVLTVHLFGIKLPRVRGGNVREC